MCSLTAAGLSAQTLTNDNVSPLDGSAFTQAGATYIAPGASGANVTWDFSALDQLSVVSFDYMSPASTPQGSSFPGANIASVTEGNTSYFNTSAAGYDLHGIYADGSDALIVYQDPERVLSYPCSYGTTWTDALLSNFELSGYQFERSGTVSGNADGYGTLIMPYGTVTNVLRVVTVEDYSDVTDLYTTVAMSDAGFGITSTPMSLRSTSSRPMAAFVVQPAPREVLVEPRIVTSALVIVSSGWRIPGL